MNGTSAGSDIAATTSAIAGDPHASPELGRVLAHIRVIIALVAATEALALSSETRPALTFAVLCYTAYAGWLGWIAASGSRSVQSPLTSWVDAIWILFLAWLAAAPSSLFILLLLFPVLFASLSYGFASGLMVALFAAVGALAIIRGQQAGVMSLESMLFPLSIVGLGPLVAGLARAGVQMNEQVTIADHLLDQADPRVGVERVAHVILHSLGRHFEADLGLLLTWLPGCEPRLFRSDRSGKVVEVQGELCEVLLDALARVPRGVASVHHLARVLGRRPVRRCRTFYVSDDLPAPEARPAMEALADLLDARSLVAVPTCRRAPQSSWLLLESARRRYRLRDADVLVHVMEQLAPVLENAGLLEQLSDEAVATERARIGRDLHDTAVQPYLGIKYGIEALARKARPENPLHEDILALQEMATSELHQLREVVSNMRAGTARGDDILAPALRRQAKRFTELFGIDVTVDCEGDIPINRKLSAAFFHLVSEALTNIRRHTHATRAEIHVSVDTESFVVRIGNDHGTAPPPVEPFVPRSIAERAESLQGRAVVDLRRRGFTDLIITIPRPSSGERDGRL